MNSSAAFGMPTNGSRPCVSSSQMVTPNDHCKQFVEGEIIFLHHVAHWRECSSCNAFGRRPLIVRTSAPLSRIVAQIVVRDHNVHFIIEPVLCKFRLWDSQTIPCRQISVNDVLCSKVGHATCNLRGPLQGSCDFLKDFANGNCGFSRFAMTNDFSNHRCA